MKIFVVVLSLVALVSANSIPAAWMTSAVAPVMGYSETTALIGAIPTTRTDYGSQVNHIVPVPAPLIKGVSQPYAVPVPQPFAVPRAVPVDVPRPVAVEVPRAVPVPMVAKAPTLFTSSIVDTGTKLLTSQPINMGLLDAKMTYANAKLW